ncbi:acyl-homoserine-lactone synthase [Pukyongiella litopenaei]|uniref:Acyl-homoserine-lactone synthase n=1 Tax=Pukyongiella litopenaei TaxID=2605946 RepID=A0A2S0MS03_9RHOB|nr:acyl-homoserine-lactone synthase [Pukyongiella litopenaei]AVO38483.1 GNAT family N-acetyltransferase [Pukyongiella litopenaei]
MIITIDALNRHRFAPVLDEMYRLRARVFQDRLGWDVDVKDGKEIDIFDNLDPAHVVCLDDDGDVVGCMRLLQTTGPHMLADVFHSILDGEAPLRSAQIWEATRFCVDTVKLTGSRKRNSISYVTSEVMIGAFEYAQKAGILDAVAVIDPVMNRVLKRSGNAPYDYLGTPKPMGKVTAMAALMDCSDERIASIREFAGIDHDVFASEEDVLKRFSRRAGPSRSGDNDAPAAELREYFAQQLREASNDDEARAVRRLMTAVTEHLPQEAQDALRRIA